MAIILSGVLIERRREMRKNQFFFVFKVQISKYNFMKASMISNSVTCCMYYAPESFDSKIKIELHRCAHWVILLIENGMNDSPFSFVIAERVIFIKCSSCRKNLFRNFLISVEISCIVKCHVSCVCCLWPIVCFIKTKWGMTLQFLFHLF